MLTEKTIEQIPIIASIASVCHAANCAYCVAVGDPTLPAWEDLEESYRESARVGVRFALQGGVTPAEQHESWRRERLAQGWTWGNVLDRAAKIHPNLVPYEDLPLIQRKKDALFQAIVRALANEGGA